MRKGGWNVGFCLIGFIGATLMTCGPVHASDIEPTPVSVLSALELTEFERPSATGHNSSVKVINFWASWCAPCLLEHPALMDMAEQGIEVIGVAYADTPMQIARVLLQRGDPFNTIYLDDDGQAMRSFNNEGVPESIIIGPDNQVRARIRGPIDWASYETIVKSALETDFVGFDTD